MAVQARYGGGFIGGAPVGVEEFAMAQEYAALVAKAAMANNGYNCAAVVSGAQSGLTCNGGGGGVVVSRKRGREVVEQYVPSSAALLPIPGMVKVGPSPSMTVDAAGSRLVESAMACTSGRPASAAAAASFGETLASDLYFQSGEIDAVVRAECERMRVGLEQARKRQCQALVRAATTLAARRLREKDAELDAARRRAAELEDRLRQAAVESQAWCGLARRNEAVAAGLRATLDHVLQRTAAPAPVEGSGESYPDAFDAAAADDAQSCCFETNKDVVAPDHSGAAGKWACKACGEREAAVLLLPCRHLSVCRGCEPTVAACPVCLAAKKAAVVARSPTEM
ncbi:hypothetical protein GUJ93_ZPchr0011g27980 [Zizania palustris]|uniref:RING-type domain-containing protein n=1 Tax=Zizania palustris TaxID=103762 RepID=A0A8J6BQS1_ZIZPA|nr:hypothetical protein GUJ93_ZPchr0011g27980 [Zizania palustris]